MDCIQLIFQDLMRYDYLGFADSNLKNKRKEVKQRR